MYLFFHDSKTIEKLWCWHLDMIHFSQLIIVLSYFKLCLNQNGLNYRGRIFTRSVLWVWKGFTQMDSDPKFWYSWNDISAHLLGLHSDPTTSKYIVILIHFQLGPLSSLPFLLCTVGKLHANNGALENMTHFCRQRLKSCLQSVSMYKIGTLSFFAFSHHNFLQLGKTKINIWAFVLSLQMSSDPSQCGVNEHHYPNRHCLKPPLPNRCPLTIDRFSSAEPCWPHLFKG